MTESIYVGDVTKHYGGAVTTGDAGTGTAGTGADDSGDGLAVLEDVSFQVEAGEFVVIVGPSGCGKTTLLKTIAGLVDPSSGDVHVGGRPVVGPSREVAMVFQDFVLLPWKTVLENVALGLKVQEGMARGPRRTRAREWVRRVGLEGFEDHYPSALSGGMQQRVGLARALAVDPDILLMDEPFGSIDAQTRQALQADLLELWAEEQKTVVFVTHDVDEAIFLADRVLVLSSKPATVVGEYTVDIDRPRWDRRLEVEGCDAFERAKQAIYETIGVTGGGRTGTPTR